MNTENREIKVLDKGFVRLVDSMGDDSSITEAARTSYGKQTKTVRDDTGLIRYLMRMNHTSPFEFVEFKFHIKCPIFVMRQKIRHRTASVNEYSGRYSVMTDDCYIPELDRITSQSTSNNQGSTNDILENASDIQEIMKFQTEESLKEYHGFLDSGLSREIARINLPLSNYTELYWKIDLHNLFHYLKLRMDSHAQYEIRVFAEAIYELIKPIVPIACEAFEDYRINACNFSFKEMDVIRYLLMEKNIPVEDIKAIIQKLDNGLSKREITELISKLGYISG